MILYYFVLFSISYHLLEAVSKANPCQTPDGKYGECKPLHQCQSLYQNLKHRNVPQRLATYARRSHCGFIGDEPKVCCRVVKTPDLNKTQQFVSSVLLPDSCGYITENKITNGEVTDLDEFPWMALLDYVDEFGSHSFLCGGALINKRYVLTAAHCISRNLRYVRLGEYNIASEIDCIGNDCAPPPLDIEIEETIQFKSYDSKDNSFTHDIALIRLKKEVEFSTFIKPICLPTTTDEIFNSHIGENLIVAGWGATENATMSNIKLKAEIPVKKCYNSGQIIIDENEICAGGASDKKDSCKGDSGGPLMGFKLDEDKDFQAYAFGVVSFGSDNCGDGKTPAVYTKVVKYMYWIVDNLKP